MHSGHGIGGGSECPSAPQIKPKISDLAMVYGGGGIFGIGYCLGVAHGLADAGLPVATAPALGTSAGSWAASAMALGLPHEVVMDLEAPRIPNRSTGVLADTARRIFGEATHPLVSVSAVCLKSRRRHILDGAKYALSDLVAASSAVPGILPPHRIDGRLYVDGGMWSATSLDSAATAKSLIVVAPLAGGAMGPLGRGAGFLLGRELQRWRRRHPDRQIDLIRPNRAISSYAALNPMSLFDAERARAVYPLAFEQGQRCAERIQQKSTARTS